jgi:8-oxo-dGTP diphosphatase
MSEFLDIAAEKYHPGLSVDCVIFGFHENELKVLLLKMKHTPKWALPGGFVEKQEHMDKAAIRVLEKRTGLADIFLQQFHTFGDPARHDHEMDLELFKQSGRDPVKDHWFLQRFITVGYYALIEFSKANPRPDDISEACEWKSIDELPAMILDHRKILEKALDTLRFQINYQPIGHKLLPVKFTMPELQKLYETILGKELDRRNFQRKMLAYGILKDLGERRKGGAHKAPFLYGFDVKKYNAALKIGLKGSW